MHILFQNIRRAERTVPGLLFYIFMWFAGSDIEENNFAVPIGLGKPDWANPGLVKFSTSISDPVTSTSLNGGKLGPFVLFLTLLFRHFGGESISYSQTNWQDNFDLIRD